MFFLRFLNFASGTKSRKAPHIIVYVAEGKLYS